MCLSINYLEKDSDSLSTAAVSIITLTFIITLTITAIVTFMVTYKYIKRKFGIEFKPDSQPQQEKALYESVDLPNKTITKDDFELQPNPAYGTSHKVIMDTNPAYVSCK